MTGRLPRLVAHRILPLVTRSDNDMTASIAPSSPRRRPPRLPLWPPLHDRPPEDRPPECELPPLPRQSPTTGSRRGLGIGKRVVDGKEGWMEMGQGMNAGQG
jgi:hypothetical protein